MENQPLGAGKSCDFLINLLLIQVLGNRQGRCVQKHQGRFDASP